MDDVRAVKAKDLGGMIMSCYVQFQKRRVTLTNSKMPKINIVEFYIHLITATINQTPSLLAIALSLGIQAIYLFI